MSNRLNFSNINDAWGESKKKIQENIMTIDSNEIKVPLKKEYKPVQETYSDYIKPCSLVEEHIHNCDVCKKKLIDNFTESSKPDSIVNRLSGKQSEHMSSNILNMSKEYLDTNFGSNYDLNEHFENISPSQKNLLVVVLYGILIILISDLIIKEKDE
jgi:hypothetical protein